MKLWRKFYECKCYEEGLMLSNSYEDEDMDVIDIALFQKAGMEIYPLCWKNRLRRVWNILRTGKPYADMVIFDSATAKALGKDLVKWAEKIEKKVKKCKSGK